jgi:CRISPR/Cas system-associated endonuclease/helicase Cas3
MENRNFPYIFLGRMIYHTSAIAKRSHAKRGVATFAMEEGFKEKWLDDGLRTKLEKYHKIFRSGKALDVKALTEYEALIYQVLQKLL